MNGGGEIYFSDVFPPIVFTKNNFPLELNVTFSCPPVRWLWDRVHHHPLSADMAGREGNSTTIKCAFYVLMPLESI